MDYSQLPSVHALADDVGEVAPRWAVVEAARRMIAAAREAITAGRDGAINAEDVAVLAGQLARPHLRRVINATGVVLHTNLGRAPLSIEARGAIDAAAAGYTNLEYDLDKGERGSRHDHLRALLKTLTGAEDAIAVNNNAAATVLGLAALATNREIIVSRGELIEIGGSFRLPEILALSGGKLVEVGTTNKTHARDYEQAIGPATGLLLKVHRSNFAMVGFTSEVMPDELVAIGRSRGIATMIDLGSGMMVDRETQRALGLPEEPTIAEAVASGADLVTFSGDKLLGGPQAGILIGKAAAVERARKHPLMRALRPDKLTLAALEATLAMYRDGQYTSIPTHAMLGRSVEQMRAMADAIVSSLCVDEHHAPGRQDVAIVACVSTVGGGAMPTAELPSVAITLPERHEPRLRAHGTPVIGRVADGRVWLDLRTVADEELFELIAAVQSCVMSPA
ncbi:MAG TPA: L-seryl-tRNA(Sec) selenium transferase [Kofleriaceae bacterium]